MSIGRIPCRRVFVESVAFGMMHCVAFQEFELVAKPDEIAAALALIAALDDVSDTVFHDDLDAVDTDICADGGNLFDQVLFLVLDITMFAARIHATFVTKLSTALRAEDTKRAFECAVTQSARRSFVGIAIFAPAVDDTSRAELVFNATDATLSFLESADIT